jgi:hypothetical protein
LWKLRPRFNKTEQKKINSFWRPLGAIAISSYRT